MARLGRAGVAIVFLAGLVGGLLVGFGAGFATGRGTPDDRTARVSPAPTATPLPSTGPRTTAAPSSAPPTPPLSRRFGVVAHLLWTDTATAIRDLDDIAAAGLGVIRFDVSWRNMEPRPGEVEDLDRLDAVMSAIEARGMRPIVTVIETPDWANAGRGPWVAPPDPDTYSRFVAMLAARYAGVDPAWEIWNEPNDPRFWQPSPDAAAYARLLAHADRAIHAAVPAATVLGGSILYGDAGFLQAMYDAGAAGTFDGLAVHPYAQNRAPADTGDPYHSFQGTLDRLRAVMIAAGDGATKMWITEAGWTADDGVDEPTRGRYLADATRMVAGRPEIEVMAAYVYGAAAEPGFDLATTGSGSVAFGAYTDAVRDVEAAGGRAP